MVHNKLARKQNNEVRQRTGTSRTILLVIVALSLALTSPGMAQRRRGFVRLHHRVAYLANLPRGNARLLVGGKEYFYSRGVFYHAGARGYVAIAAPIGARIRVLPTGYTTIAVGGGSLFCYYGTYYRYDPAERSYIVVNAPATGGNSVPLTQDHLEMVDGTSLDGTFVGGDTATIQFETGGTTRNIPIEQINSITFAPPSPN